MLLKGKRKKQAIGTISKGAQILNLAEKDYKTTAINIFKVVEKKVSQIKGNYDDNDILKRQFHYK